MHGNEPRLMEINSKPGREGKGIESFFEKGDGGNVGATKDKGIICILQDRAREGVVDWVRQLPGSAGRPDQALKDIGHNDKEIRR